MINNAIKFAYYVVCSVSGGVRGAAQSKAPPWRLAAKAADRHALAGPRVCSPTPLLINTVAPAQATLSAVKYLTETYTRASHRRHAATASVILLYLCNVKRTPQQNDATDSYHVEHALIFKFYEN